MRRALVPGCGRGYDVYLLAAHGWDAVGLEVSAEAVRNAEAVRPAVEGGGVDWYVGRDPQAPKGTASFVVCVFFMVDRWKQVDPEAKQPLRFDLIYDYTVSTSTSAPNGLKSSKP